MRDSAAGSISLAQLYEDGQQFQAWDDYRDFRRMAISCPLVERIPAGSSYTYTLANRNIGSFVGWLDEHSGQSGKHRWRNAQEQNNHPGSLTTSQVQKLTGFTHRNSVYSLQHRNFEVQKVDGVLLFNRQQIEGQYPVVVNTTTGSSDNLES